jgi:hypothetical protein
MPDVFDRAESWRSRAHELRLLAADMRDATARGSLLANARALEEHADKLEEVLLKVCRLGRRRGMAGSAAGWVGRAEPAAVRMR